MKQNSLGSIKYKTAMSLPLTANGACFCSGVAYSLKLAFNGNSKVPITANQETSQIVTAHIFNHFAAGFGYNCH